jgi:hypothetical protein
VRLVLLERKFYSLDQARLLRRLFLFVANEAAEPRWYLRANRVA